MSAGLGLILKAKATESPPVRAKAAEADDSDNVEARIQSLARSLPLSPYLLSVPSQTPYRASPEYADSWRVGLPFDKDEEELQYMSFLSREGEDTILIARGGWDQPDLIKGTTTHANGLMSGTGTPMNGKPKKMTLSDYKNKSRAATPANGARVDVKEKPANPTKQLEKDKANVNTVTSPSPNQNKAKRSLDDTTDSQNSTSSKPDSPSRAKRPRISPEPEASQSSDSMQSQKADSAASFSLPPLLSPTLPPRIEQELLRLEQGESPYENGLTHLGDLSHGTSSSDERNSEIKRQVYLGAKTKAAQKGTKATQNRDASSPEKENGHKLGVAMRKPKRRPTPEGRETAAGQRPTKAEKVHGLDSEILDMLGETEPSLIVKLAYPKSMRKSMRAILAEPPRPKRTGNSSLSTSTDHQKNDHSKSQQGRDRSRDGRPEAERQKAANKELRKGKEAVASDTPDEGRGGLKRPPTSGEKRKEVDGRSNNPAAKRQKVPESLDMTIKPRTPISQPFKSPAFSNPGSSHKSRLSTPIKDAKTASKRPLEAENNASTPRAVRATEPPRSAEKTNGTMSASVTEKIEAWKQEHKKYVDLGKRLKSVTEAALVPKHEGAVLAESVRKQAAVLGLEAVLSWILAFHANDEIQRLRHAPFDGTMWRSLLAFWRFVERQCRPFRGMHGLACQIGAMIHEIIHIIDIEKLNTETLPESSAGLRPPSSAAGDDPGPATPGAPAANTTSSTGSAASPPPAMARSVSSQQLQQSALPDKAAVFRRQYVDFKRELVLMTREMGRLWQQGTADLSIGDLETGFPKTWATRSTTPLASEEKVLLTPREYKGGFYLPFGSLTSVMEVVRGGLALVTEWADRERVDWQARLVL